MGENKAALAGESVTTGTSAGKTMIRPHGTVPPGYQVTKDEDWVDENGEHHAGDYYMTKTDPKTGKESLVAKWMEGWEIWQGASGEIREWWDALGKHHEGEPPKEQGSKLKQAQDDENAKAYKAQQDAAVEMAKARKRKHRQMAE